MVEGIVSPMVSPWDLEDVKDVYHHVADFEQRKDEYLRDAIPFVTGFAAAAAYDLAGLAVIWFAPPWLKPIGVAMVAPGPSEAALFALGYYWGYQIKDDVPAWLI